jgi:hypothetical protein
VNSICDNALLYSGARRESWIMADYVRQVLSDLALLDLTELTSSPPTRVFFKFRAAICYALGEQAEPGHLAADRKSRGSG